MQTRSVGMVYIRWHRRGDAPELAEILRNAYPDEDWDVTSVIQFMKRDRRCVRPIVCENGDVVGAIMYRFMDGKPQTIELARLAVHPSCRRERIGTYALKALAGPSGALVALGVLRACVHECNAAGLAFLRANSFTVDKAAPIRRGHFRDGRDGYQLLYQKPAPRRPRFARASAV